MEIINVKDGLSRKEKYESLIPQLEALVTGEKDLIANVANIVAGLKEVFHFFWVGVYFVKENNGREELVLGPFQGPIACVRISKGKGVCGVSWESKEAIIVEDVEKFPGHIACSPLSKSEIVIPVFKNETVVAVIDVDSTRPGDFNETDKIYLSHLAKLISQMI